MTKKVSRRVKEIIDFEDEILNAMYKEASTAIRKTLAEARKFDSFAIIYNNPLKSYHKACRVVDGIRSMLAEVLDIRKLEHHYTVGITVFAVVKFAGNNDSKKYTYSSIASMLELYKKVLKQKYGTQDGDTSCVDKSVEAGCYT